MFSRLIILLLFVSTNLFAQENQFLIAFGSCANQNHPLPVFKRIVREKPDLFIFLGDNIYADTRDSLEMREKYKQLAKHKGYKKLTARVPVIATWDDHDYGENDAGRHYPMKETAKDIFLDFFKEPKESSRRAHSGIYHSSFFTVNGKTIQVILLDTRSFRDNLLSFRKGVDDRAEFFYQRDYLPHITSDSTILGTEQWVWLEGELKKPADLRFICSSTQFATSYNGYESWANFPFEQERMFRLIRTTNASRVVFLSGDLHYAELSVINRAGIYPIYDLTASGLSSTWDFSVPNNNRVAGPVMENNFGLLSVDFFSPTPFLQMEIIDVKGNKRISKKVLLSELVY